MFKLPKREIWIFVGCFIPSLIVTLAYHGWQGAWIDCPAECGGQVQRKNKNKHFKPCDHCAQNIWTCVTNHKRPCQVKGCKVENGYYWVCPIRPDGVDMSTERLHGDGICNVIPRPSSTRAR